MDRTKNLKDNIPLNTPIPKTSTTTNLASYFVRQMIYSRGGEVNKHSMEMRKKATKLNTK